MHTLACTQMLQMQLLPLTPLLGTVVAFDFALLPLSFHIPCSEALMARIVPCEVAILDEAVVLVTAWKVMDLLVITHVVREQIRKRNNKSSSMPIESCLRSVSLYVLTTFLGPSTLLREGSCFGTATICGQTFLQLLLDWTYGQGGHKEGEHCGKALSGEIWGS
jgi:hypothetical protein